MQGFITYAGSKEKLIDQIAPYIWQSNADNLCDLFCGAGSVTNSFCHSFRSIVANDINKDLIALMRSFSYGDYGTFDKYYNYNYLLENAPESKEEYLSLRESYNYDVANGLRGSTKTALKFLQLALSCTNNMVRFNRKNEFNQTYGNRKINCSSIDRMEKFSNNINEYGNVQFISKSYKDIDIADDTLIYIDPPYSNTQTKYYGWNEKDDIELANWIFKQNNNVCVSSVSIYDGKRSKLVDLLSEHGFEIYPIKYDYEKAARRKGKEQQEVICINY